MIKLLEDYEEPLYTDYLTIDPLALVQHTLAWRDVILGVGQDEPRYLIARDGMDVTGVMPAFIYRCDLGDVLVSSPQAGSYGGPLSVNFSQEALIEKWLEVAEREGCVLASVCAYRDLPIPEGAEVRQCIGQWLTLDQVELNSNIKRNILKAKNENIEFHTDDGGSPTLTRAWYELYQTRCAIANREPIPLQMFLGIARMIREHGYGFAVYGYKGYRMVSGVICVGMNRTVDYYMSAFAPECVDSGANIAGIYYAMKYARETRGFTVWNWQGSGSRSSGVYHFKAQWGSKDAPYWYVSKITGDVSKIQAASLEEVKEKYRWHYVPWELCGEGK